MSLLEDVFLNDEAGEAQELERVIEGDEYEVLRATSPNSDLNSEKEDEAEEDKRRVDPTHSKAKQEVKHPRFILNPARLTGPRGIHVIPEHFKDFKFKGKGHEKDDLDLILKKLEHWAYRLYPKFEFEDCLKKIETLGKKRPVMVHLQKIRSDQYTTEDTVMRNDSSDEEVTQPVEDEFDKLLQQQITLAQATPKPSSVNTPTYITTPRDILPSIMPKVTSSPSISEEQRERMIRNRRLAEDRRLAKRINDADSKKLELNSSSIVVDEGTIQMDASQEISNTEKDIQRKSTLQIIDNCDEINTIETISGDKSEDIVESKNSVDDISSNSDNKVQNICVSPSKYHDKSDKTDTNGKELSNGIESKVLSIVDNLTEKPVSVEIMEVDFSEVY